MWLLEAVGTATENVTYSSFLLLKKSLSHTRGAYIYTYSTVNMKTKHGVVRHDVGLLYTAQPSEKVEKFRSVPEPAINFHSKNYICMNGRARK
jgi:hypothetical protein